MTQIAEVQHLVQKERATKALNELAEILKNHGSGERVNWGHVGDMADLAATLTNQADRFLGRGEYA